MRPALGAVLVVASSLMASTVHAKIFDNDTFRISQEASDSFGFFVNGDRTRTLTGLGDLTTVFTQQELVSLLLPNNGISMISLTNSNFFEFVARDLKGLVDITLVGSDVRMVFRRELVTESKSGRVSLKYDTGSARDRNFVSIVGEALTNGGGGDDTPVVVVPPGDPGSEESGGSRGGSGPFFNDEFTITKNGDAFELEINGIQLTTIADTGGDLMFAIPEDTLKALLLVNNGVTGVFLDDQTEFFEFLSKGNAGLIDVTLGSNIGFKINRDFVLNEQSGESSFKYDAGGKKVRNFVNFVGKVNPASPSS